MDKIPEGLVRYDWRQAAKITYSRDINPALVDLFVCHAVLNCQNYGPLATLINGTLVYPGFGKKKMSGKDRLGNPNVDFPIGFVFGDSDLFGTEGAD